MTDPTHLRILRLSAENVLGIKAVEIEPSPDGGLVIIGGRNGQGKTSVINSIWLALGGASASRAIADQLRHGADGGNVTIDLGEMTVTRVWKADGSSKLEVRGAQGGKFSSPQAMLDDLVGRISFDPMAFLRLRPVDQVAALLELIDLPFNLDEMATMRQGYYDERTEIGRTVKSLEGQLDGLPHVDDVPDEEIDVSVLMRELDDILQTEAQRREALTRSEAATRRADEQDRRVTELLAALEEAEAHAVTLRDEAAAAAEYAESLPEVDTSELRGRIDTVQSTNEAVRGNQQRAAIIRSLAEARSEYDARTADIDNVDTARSDALAAAAMPIPGLGISDDGNVTYQGIRLDQCSGAEQLRVAIAMAMALNPTVRVILVTDGSLLDEDNLALIAQMAAEGDYQVWIERVGTGDDLAVIIEDGEVVS